MKFNILHVFDYIEFIELNYFDEKSFNFGIIIEIIHYLNENNNWLFWNDHVKIDILLVIFTWESLIIHWNPLLFIEINHDIDENDDYCYKYHDYSWNC